MAGAPRSVSSWLRKFELMAEPPKPRPTCSPTLLTKRASSDELRRTFENVESVSSNVSSR